MAPHELDAHCTQNRKERQQERGGYGDRRRIVAPDGYHSHSTPLHQAVWSNSANAVRLLVERGARLDIQDTVHRSTPLDWAIYGERTAIADYLRDQGAPTK
jgi:hypothetical protein